MTENNSEPLLEVKNLKTYFHTDDGIVKAVDGVDFCVYPGEVLGLVGESGCGKSVTSFSVMRLVDSPGRIEEGEIFFEGKDLLKISEKEMVKLRGEHITMIFQQPQTSLNPVFTIGDQIVEVFQIHSDISKEEAKEKAIQLLEKVGIADPHKKINAYPHEMSGGQAQRVMIAMGLALNTQLLIADEPTTALDVTIQAQILDLLRDLQESTGTSIILITHDLGVIAEMADRIAIMYAGRVVEEAPVLEFFKNPIHPYSQGLIASVPILGVVKDSLETIPGNVPNLIDLPAGCRFAPRCILREKYNLEVCTHVEPDLISWEDRHTVRCWLYEDSDEHKAPLKKSTTK
ncbi:MAG: ABC transporter ATP-binding protein [Anaerolineaceae bacterium]|nr:ABC transporter ATP-binding protein [Anaerolineaceae bacterium]